MSLNWEAIQKASKDLENNLKEAHQKLNSQEFEGDAGAGMVKVTMLGNFRVKSVNIDPRLLADNRDDEALHHLLSDLSAAAYNDAVNKIEAAAKTNMVELASKVDLSKDDAPS